MWHVSLDTGPGRRPGVLGRSRFPSAPRRVSSTVPAVDPGAWDTTRTVVSFAVGWGEGPEKHIIICPCFGGRFEC